MESIKEIFNYILSIENLRTLKNILQKNVPCIVSNKKNLHWFENWLGTDLAPRHFSKH